MTAIALWAYREGALRTGAWHLENLTTVLVEQTADAVKGVDLVLMETADDYSRRYASGPAFSTAALHQQTLDRIGELPQVRALLVADGGGDVVLHSHGYPPPVMNYRDRDYFEVHRDFRVAGLYVGAPVEGRVVKGITHTLSRRIAHRSGEFLGVVAASIDIEYFHGLYRSLALGPAGRVLLFRRDGTLLTTYPAVPDNANRSFSRHPLFETEIPRRGAGLMESRGFLDGELRTIAYRSVRDYPLVIAVTSTRGYILGEWRRQAWQIGAGAALSAAFSVFLGLWLARRLRMEAALAREVQASERRWLMAMEAAGHGVWDWDVAAGSTFRSPRYCEILGYAPDEILDGREGWLRLLHPDDRRLMHDLNRRCVDGDMDTFSAEIRLRCRDGDWKWVLNRGTVVNREPGGRAQRILGTITDVTEHRQTQQQLRDSEARLNGVIESAMDAIITIDREQRIVLFNSAAERIFRCIRSEAIGKPLDRFVPARYRALHRGHVENFGATGVSTRHMGARNVLYGLRADGEEFPIDASISQAEIDGIQYFTVILRDVTLQQKAAEELAETTRQLRELHARMHEVREAERTRIARELHDELAQWLTALKMDVAWVSSRLPRELVPLIDRAARMRDVVDTTVAAVRRIAADLRPVMLDDLGMVPAIENLLHEFSRRTGLVVGLDVADAVVELKDPVATAVYRMVQEALTNIARHAQASEARVAIKTDGDTLAVSVRDNGRGFDASREPAGRSFGLLGIRERAQTLGGSATIASTPGAGTVVSIRIPLNLHGVMEGRG